jgi:hypothetical protein
VNKYLRIFDIIEHNAYGLSLEDDKIVVGCSVPQQHTTAI